MLAAILLFAQKVRKMFSTKKQKNYTFTKSLVNFKQHNTYGIYLL